MVMTPEEMRRAMFKGRLLLVAMAILVPYVLIQLFTK